MSTKNIYIIKASGEREQFDPSKVINSLKRTGVTKNDIKAVLKGLYPKIHDGMTTTQIYKIVYDLLASTEERGAAIAGRYSLKKAIADLGPTGFPFEKFIAGIFEHIGYKTSTNLIIQGKCVSHEVDILAIKDNENNVMESKFHKRPGYKTTVKTALYIYARYMDIKESAQVSPNPIMWLVTNAKVTSEVKKYGMCTGLRILSWDYPSNYSLRDLIDKSGLHPVTALYSLDSFTREILLNNGVIFCTEIEKNKHLFKNENYYNKIVQEARMLIGK